MKKISTASCCRRPATIGPSNRAGIPQSMWCVNVKCHLPLGCLFTSCDGSAHALTALAHMIMTRKTLNNPIFSQTGDINSIFRAWQFSTRPRRVSAAVLVCVATRTPACQLSCEESDGRLSPPTARFRRVTSRASAALSDGQAAARSTLTATGHACAELCL